ncbi:hypothetical protein PF008_g29298 [Phytophthora fragariae]|uniref:Uncharacterized protein n=1 Tax=Phytophthora fragariae TaxID=53985 RepID=A0A6G0Q8W0_9STRA|nr:hypothetical protein PF008_g29298 [Phytophthora fragariae]
MTGTRTSPRLLARLETSVSHQPGDPPLVTPPQVASRNQPSSTPRKTASVGKRPAKVQKTGGKDVIAELKRQIADLTNRLQRSEAPETRAMGSASSQQEEVDVPVQSMDRDRVSVPAQSSTVDLGENGNGSATQDDVRAVGSGDNAGPSGNDPDDPDEGGDDEGGDGYDRAGESDNDDDETDEVPIGEGGRAHDDLATQDVTLSSVNDEEEDLRPAVRNLSRSGKADRKNMTIEQFSGTTPVKAFDSCVRGWWGEFSKQLLQAQVMSNCRWSKLQCKGVFESSLTGDAREWFNSFRTYHPSVSLAECGHALIEEFKNPLSEQEIMRLLITERKRPSETYRQFADRLLNMADSLPGGVGMSANARHALHTFVQHAYPEQSKFLKLSLVKETQLDPVRQLNRAVQHLCFLVDSDGLQHTKNEARGEVSILIVRIEPLHQMWSSERS